MECLCLCSSTPPILPFPKTVAYHNGHNFPSNFKNPKLLCPTISTPKYTANCRERTGEEYAPLSCISAYAVLDVEPDCSAAELKAAFRAKVHSFVLLELVMLFLNISLVVKKIAEKKKKMKENGVLSYGFLLL